MLVYMQSIIAIGLGVVSAYTDFKEKKIYNKSILIAVIISIFTYVVFYKEIEIIYIKNYIINILISIIISLLFYYFKIWAAGDAKLFIAITLMIPYQIYETCTKNVFPALFLLIMIFGIAFIYIVFETLYLWIKDRDKFQKLKGNSIKKEDIKDFIIQYFMGYFLIMFVRNITNIFMPWFQTYNGGLALICNMLILLFSYRIITTKKKIYVTLIVSFILNCIYYLIYGITFGVMDIKIFAIVIAIMSFRLVSEKYNYEEIEVKDLKPRMILSFGSVMKFYTSRVKGLPKNTTETTDSRLNEEEIESIKRWSKTKKGEKTIVIVRHMPFAPFILLGEILFFILKIYS